MLTHPGPGILRGGRGTKIYKILLILTFSAMSPPTDYIVRVPFGGSFLNRGVGGPKAWKVTLYLVLNKKCVYIPILGFLMLDQLLTKPGPGILRGGRWTKIYKILLILTFSAMTAPTDYIES